MSSSCTNSTTSASCDPNLPKGDGISVSMKAGRFHVSNVTTSDIPDPHAMSTNKVNQTGPSPMVQSVDVNSSSKSYAGVTSGVQNDNTKGKSNFRTLKTDNVFTGVDVSIPRKVVQSVSAEFENTLYVYVIGKRIAFPVVEYFVRNNWAKYGLKRVMMNANGFFFFKFDTQVGLDTVIEGGPWMIKNNPIILKKWTMCTSLTREELTHILVWVKLHDVPLQVFNEDGISIIATHIGKPIMLDSYTSSMCIDSWGRSSFARCLIEIDSKAALKEYITVGVPYIDELGFSSETIRVEYEWKPPRCDVCLIFGHSSDTCPKKVVTTPVVEKSNDGFQQVGKKGKNKKVAKDNNAGNVYHGVPVGKNMQYRPKATTTPSTSTPTQGEASTSAGSSHKPVGASNSSVNSDPKVSSTSTRYTTNNNSHQPPKGIPPNVAASVTTSNPFDSLPIDDDGDGNREMDDEDEVVNVFDESGNLFDKSGASTPALNVPDV